MTEYLYPPTPPEALTIARRLERAGYADTDNASTADWLASLAVYEELMATATRRATFKQRTIDLDGVVLAPDDAALAELAARVAALDAHAARMRAAVAYLDGLLDRYRALPATAEAHGAACAIAGRYIARRTRVKDGPTEAVLADLLVAAWSLAGRVREAYRLLSPAGKADAVASWGVFEDANGFGPLLGRTPQEAVRALDRRAAALGVMRDKRGL